jgi:hypothetical protein
MLAALVNVVDATNCAPDVPGHVRVVAVLGLKGTTGRDPPPLPKRESFPAATVPEVVPTLSKAAPPNVGQVPGAPEMAVWK